MNAEATGRPTTLSSVQSIRRAFDVLEALAPGPLGVTQVALRTGLPKSTAARLLSALASEGVVEQVPGETRWRLGQRIAVLAATLVPGRSLVAAARPHLTALASLTGEAVGLSVADGTAVHYVDQVDTRHAVGVRDWTGTRLPMHAVSAGIVFLAHARPDELRRFLELPLERFTDRTVVDRAELVARIRQAQVDGYAWTRDEFADGLTSVAAPVTGGSGEIVAAIHVHGPTYRFPPDGREVEIAEQVVTTAGRVSVVLRTPA